MFHEAVEHVLRFIGTRPPDSGCTSVELGEFINEDVIPYFGFAANEMLCTSIMRLVLDRHHQEVNIIKKKVVLDESATTDGRTNADSAESCSKSEVLRMLDESNVVTSALPLVAGAQQQQHRSNGSIKGSRKTPSFILVIFPLTILSEKFFGFSLRFAADRESMRFLCQHAVEGVDPMGKKGNYLVGKGIRALLASGVVQVVFLLDVNNRTLYKRYFPFFAVPKTLRDSEEGDQAASLLQPLDHFFQRCRRRSSLTANCPFSSVVVLNLSLVKHIVSTSPERKALLQDAVDSVLKAHQCVIPFRYHEVSKQMKSKLISLFEAAGLRVVVAQIMLRGSIRQFKLVIPEEDWEVFMDEQRMRQRAEAGAKKEEENDEGGSSSSEEDYTNGNEEDSSQMDEINSDAKGLDQRQLIKAAQFPFFSSPDFPRGVQFCQEAERRPIALLASFPQVRLANQRASARYLYNMVVRYYETSGTLNRHSGVVSSGKQFSLIFYPKTERDTQKAGSVKQELFHGEEHSTSNNHENVKGIATANLPRGTSAYSVTKVMEVLESSPYKATTVSHLKTILDLTTLNRRVLPYLKESGKIQTSGYTPPNRKRRVGIIALPEVELTEQLKALIVEECENAGAAASAASLEKNVSVESLPQMLSSDVTSRARTLLESPITNSRILGTADKVIMSRNGLSRHGLQRAGRMHLELWRQFYQRMENITKVVMEDGKTTVAPDRVVPTLEDVYVNMSLSTFCVVVGMPRVDLGVFTQLNQSLNAQHAVSQEEPAQLQWSTKLADLPPSFKEWCITQSTVFFLASIKELASRNLVRCIRGKRVVELDPSSAIPLDEIKVMVEPVGFVDLVKYVFYDENDEFTAGRTAHSLLLFWEGTWKNIQTHSYLYYASKRPHIDIEEVQKHLTLAKTIAAAKLFHLDVSILSELLFPRCGRRIERRRNARFRDLLIRSRNAKKSKAAFKFGLTAMDRSGSMVTNMGRVDVTGETVARVVRLALESDIPLGNVLRVASSVQTAKRSQHPQNPSLSVYNRLSRAEVNHLAYLTRLVTSKYDSMVEGPRRRSVMIPATVEERREMECALKRILSPDVVNEKAAVSTSNESSNGPPKNFTNEPEVTVTENTGAAARNDAHECDPHSTPAEEVFISEEHFELLLDAFRCVLLTDQSHYKPSVAKQLITAFPPAAVAEARRYLLGKRCFTKGNMRGRIPLITLSEGLSVISPATVRRLPNPCTNSLLAQDWVQALEEATVVTSRTPQHSMVPPVQRLTSTSPPPPPLAPDSYSGTGTADSPMDPSTENRPYGLPLQSLWKTRPKAVEVRLSEPVEVQAAQLMQSDDMLASLHFPSFSFSNAAFALDGPHCAERQDHEKSLRLTTRKLYPARLMTHSIKEMKTGSHRRIPRRAILMAADSVPGDAPPSEEQKNTVEEAIERIKAISSTKGNGTTAQPLLYGHCSAGNDGCSLPYPSIFHHVDGAFHTYVWKMFLEVLVKYVRREPGISYGALKAVMTEDGLIGPRSFVAAISHLLDSGDLIGREMRTPCLSIPQSNTKEPAVSPFAQQRKRRRETEPDGGNSSSDNTPVSSLASCATREERLSNLCLFSYLKTGLP